VTAGVSSTHFTVAAAVASGVSPPGSPASFSQSTVFMQGAAYIWSYFSPRKEE